MTQASIDEVTSKIPGEGEPEQVSEDQPVLSENDAELVTKPGKRPTVIVRQRLSETVDVAESILIANAELGLYRRGNLWVQVVRNADAGTPGLDSFPSGSL